MRRNYIIFLLVFLLFPSIVTSCAEVNTIDSLASESTTSAIVETLNYNGTEYIVLHTVYATVDDSHKKSAISIVVDDTNSWNTNAYLCNQLSNKQSMLYLGQWEYNALKNGSIIANDFNHDGLDEIIMFLEITGNGGTIAGVYSISDNQITLSFDFYDNLPQLSYTPIEGKKVKIENELVSLSAEIDISSQFPDNSFDKAGVLMRTFPFSMHIEPIDGCVIQNDSVVCSMPVSVHDVVAKMCVWYQYDFSLDTFKIAKITIKNN